MFAVWPQSLRPFSFKVKRDVVEGSVQTMQDVLAEGRRDIHGSDLLASVGLCSARDMAVLWITTWDAWIPSPLLCLCKRVWIKHIMKSKYFRRSSVIKKKNPSPFIRVSGAFKLQLLELWTSVSFLRKHRPRAFSSYSLQMGSVSCAFSLFPNDSFMCKICTTFEYRTQLTEIPCRIFSKGRKSCVLCAGLPAYSGGLATDPDGAFSGHQSARGHEDVAEVRQPVWKERTFGESTHSFIPPFSTAYFSESAFRYGTNKACTYSMRIYYIFNRRFELSANK